MNGSLTMKNGKIDKYLFGGGYAQASVASLTTDIFAFYYYNQDHLGNIREVVDASGTVKQVTNYYPFGAPYADIPAGSTNPDFQPYKYNGKELDKMQGLNTYDYGARQHDPILARWDRIDPLCEKYYDISPYVYCNNNPVIHIDKDGKVPVVLIGALLGAVIEGGIAYSEGKSTREIMGASAKGLIEGAVMTIPFANASAAIATSTCAGGIGSCIEQYIGTGTIETKEVMESTLSGAISGGTSHVTSQMLSKTKNMIEDKIEQKFSSEVVQKTIKKEVQTEMKQAGKAISGKSARQSINSTTARRIKVLKEAEKSEINFASKTADYIQQQINAKAGDWIINGVFNKK